jgi:hypothetical protein
MKHLKLFPLLCCLILSFTSESQTNYRSSISSNQQTANSPAHSKKVVGYFPQWAIYGRDYNVLDIEGDKLTHIMYAFFDTTLMLLQKPLLLNLLIPMLILNTTKVVCTPLLNL